ncbi:uncharacterized protein LY89DRAFT_579705 [Mollisia scopiformis]|uniref:RRM domain-containing protein n=1 Tax=Mollisia scopiformis TaxID=149040 RepID=A0A194XI28_MOLSC|nr:uncharacterized protein LY89DRAFT_579705 [Mollisia scopiformis]KUJ19791.1 hypothetical protein LY89DRAFT_579705 [Mollisia scopiformis]
MQPSGFAYELDDYYDHHHAPSYPYGRSRGGYGSRGNYASRRLGGSRRDEHKSENIVTIERIYNGSDVRTTIMVRNIPNKMNQMELKAFLDQTSRGKYDFMYLRIDFSNGANVGYAFVNYLDPMDIIEFIRARANRRWEDFHSDKVAEVSYATIQGRDCLIQKFRNSSVMLEPEECRPKLFYTEGHPLAGQEEPFPRSDNQSKLQRSCQNAEHVGLFAPAAGQHHRFEQRNRLSQFDRGTTMAAQEYEENFDGPFGNSYHGSYHRGGHRGGFSRGGGFARGGRGGRGGYLGWNGNDAHRK